MTARRIAILIPCFLLAFDASGALTLEHVLRRVGAKEAFPETLGLDGSFCPGDAPDASATGKPADPLTCRGPVYAGMPEDDRTILAATENGRSPDPKQNATVPQFFSQDLIRPGNESLYLEPGERSGGTVAIIDGVQVTGKQLFCEVSGSEEAVDGYLCPPAATAALAGFDVPLTKAGAKVSVESDSRFNRHVIRTGKLVLDSDFTGEGLTRGIASPAGTKLLSYGASPAAPESSRLAVTEAMKQIYEHNLRNPADPIPVVNISLGGDLADRERKVLYGICRHRDSKTLNALAASGAAIPKTLSPEEVGYVHWRRLELQGKTLVVIASGNDGAPAGMSHGKCTEFMTTLFVGGSSSYSAGGSRWKSGLQTDASGTAWRNGSGSNFGPEVTVEAAADPMVTETPRKGVDDDEVGTSFSAPQASGAALVLHRVNAGLDAVGKALVLEATASRLPRLPNSPGGNGKDENGLPYYASENGIVNLPLAAAVARKLKTDPEARGKWDTLRANCKTGCRTNVAIRDFLEGVAARIGEEFTAKNPEPAAIPKPLPQCRALVDAYEAGMNGFLMTGRKKRIGKDLNPYFLRVCEVYQTLKFRNAARTFGCENT